uniref:Ribosomal protein S14 n=1 Tax=Dictyopteris divaricata TaxID=156996 RepID=A0A4Y5T7L9_9PHAE|nr:ribosomal protein S14 [Dictyopteris divaricata]QDB64146.1 ribosomal protein S14 [Dictyopteris divaricata]
MVMTRSDYKRRVSYSLKENQRKVLKSISFNQNLSLKVRWQAQVDRSKVSRQSSLSRVRNHCVQTARSRSVIGYYKLSRLRLRKLASQGVLPGLRKASW